MKPLLVVDSPKRFGLHVPGTELVSSYQYLSDSAFAQGPGRKVFNLCRSFKYQAAGYYVSLLAEARGHKPLPSLSAIQDLRLTPVIKLVSHDIEELIQSSLKRIKSPTFELSVYFGRNLAAEHERLALAVFNAFPAPLLRATFERDKAWSLSSVRLLGLGDVPDAHRQFLIEQAEKYLKRRPRKAKEETPTRFDLAILHDPSQEFAPSDAGALKKFIRAGETFGINCELIEKDAYGRIAEYDALFIRETTYVNHHTYRFARRAAAEGMVVIDDPVSIMRCTNKVFLAESMARRRVPIPKTLILSRDNAADGIRSLGLPCVIKQPDGSFSQGVNRVDDDTNLETLLDEQFANTDLLVAQEYVPTDFDWRIGLLGGEPLYACRYGMADGHWQIVRREGSSVRYGDFEPVPISKVPPDVIRLARRAAAVMGEGLYGVDLKVVRGTPVVIEVNDNPSIDEGVEDSVLGDELYRRIMQHFFWKLEAR